MCEFNPTIDDIGRRVVFYGKWGDQLLPAYGELVSFDERFVYVRYGDSDPIPALRDELGWAGPENTKLAPTIEEIAPMTSGDEPELPLTPPRAPASSQR